jgi:SAM-dependent methyltransferase
MEASVSLFATAPAVALRELRDLASQFVGLDSHVYGDERYHRVLALMHAMCAGILECEAAGVARAQIVDALQDVRAIHARSPFVKRLQEWPRGYPGDFETVEYICNAINRAPVGTLAHTCESYALTRSVAQQHRNKIQHQSAQILRAMLLKPGRSRVLSIACGSCADVQRILPFIQNVVGELYLNDADPSALDYSRSILAPIAHACRFLQGNALRVAKRLEREATFDLVVAGGLFDYLPAKHATYLIETIYHRLLSPDGSLFFTNIASGNPYRPLIEYFGDWFLIERTDDDIRDYCRVAAIPTENVKIARDETGLAHLIEVTRRETSNH